jgi:hypothetical protein
VKPLICRWLRTATRPIGNKQVTRAWFLAGIWIGRGPWGWSIKTPPPPTRCLGTSVLRLGLPHTLVTDSARFKIFMQFFVGQPSAQAVTFRKVTGRLKEILRRE